jgi:hypothetical protein
LASSAAACPPLTRCSPRTIVTALRDAEPEHKLDVYRNLGLRLTYYPKTRTVRADIDLAAHSWEMVCVRGSTQTNAQRSASLSTTIALP